MEDDAEVIIIIKEIVSLLAISFHIVFLFCFV